MRQPSNIGKVSEIPANKRRIGCGICILTGKVQGGKTSLAASVVSGLQKRGLRVAGVISRGVDQEGKRLGYQLVNIQSAEMCILASVEPKTDWARFRRFYFNPEAIDRGCSWLEQGLLKGVDLLVIDEVGPMELQGGGWSRVLDKIVTMEAPVCQLWVVRERILASVMERWSLDDAQIMQQDQWTSENIIEYMLHKMKTYE